jgi:branched-chain amino acid transport system substrate-binding protein
MAVLGLVGAACGSSNKSGSSSATTTPAAPATGGSATAATTRAAPAKSPIKLAVLSDESGVFSSDQGQTCAITKAWATAENASGGVAGHPFTVDCNDTGGDATKGASVSAAVVADQGYAAAILTDAAAEAAIGPVLSSGKLPTTGVMYYPTVVGQLPYIYSITTTFPAVVDEQLIAPKALGLTKVGTATCAETAACSAATPLYSAAATKLGLDFIGEIKISNSAPNYTAQCLEFISKGAEYIQMGLGSDAAGRLSSDCTTQGYTGWFGASAGTVSPALYNIPKLRLTGGLNAFPWYASDAPVVAFRDAMNAAAIPEKKWANPTATGVWASLSLLAKALTNNAAGLSDPVTRSDVAAAYATVSNETLGGLMPQPITFGTDALSKPVNCFWLFTAPGDGTVTGSYKPSCDTLTTG